MSARHLSGMSVCLQILNSFNISGMDEATLLKWKWGLGFGRVHTRNEKNSSEAGVVWVT